MSKCFFLLKKALNKWSKQQIRGANLIAFHACPPTRREQVYILGREREEKEELNGKRLSFSPPGTETSQSGYIAECAYCIYISRILSFAKRPSCTEALSRESKFEYVHSKCRNYALFLLPSVPGFLLQTLFAPFSDRK